MTISAIMRRIHEADIKRGGVGYIDPQVKRPQYRMHYALHLGIGRPKMHMKEIWLKYSSPTQSVALHERAYLRTDMIEKKDGQ